MKKTLGIISNILSVLLVGPFSIYFSALGLMFITSIDFTWSFSCIINAFSTPHRLSKLIIVHFYKNVKGEERRICS